MRVNPLMLAFLAVLTAGLTLLAAWWSVPAIVILFVFAAVAFGIGAVWRRTATSTTAQEEAKSSSLPAGFGRALLQQMPAPLILISNAGRLTYANPAAIEILPRSQIGGHISTVIRAPAFLEPIEEILIDGQDAEFNFTLSGDQERYFEARASMLPPGATDFGDDVHVIVQIEDRTRDKASLQTRSDFIANASHELRTPLASILGYIETLQGHAKDDPEAREKFLEIMMSQASRMQRLVDDLMSLSRIEMDAHVRPEEVLDLNKIAVDSASSMFPLATVNDVILQVDINSDAQGPRVLGDRDQLAQVIVNLVDNAIKYGGSGKTVRVAASEPDPRYPGQVGISVFDSGPGIPREAIHRLTERFFRVNASHSKNMGGTGLGLAITKHILTRHYGALDVQSRPGEGSKFTLWLPYLELDDAMELAV